MAAQTNLEDLVSLIEKAVRPGPLARLLGSDSGSKELTDLLAGLSKTDTTAQVLPSSSSISDIINAILEILGIVTPSPFEAIARRNLNSNVLITTTAGTVEGVITDVGNWHVVLTEAQGTTVIVNFANTLAIDIEGPGVGAV